MASVPAALAAKPFCLILCEHRDSTLTERTRIRVKRKFPPTPLLGRLSRTGLGLTCCGSGRPVSALLAALPVYPAPWLMSPSSWAEGPGNIYLERSARCLLNAGPASVSCELLAGASCCCYDGGGAAWGPGEIPGPQLVFHACKPALGLRHFPPWLTPLLPLILWDSGEWALWLAGDKSGGSWALSPLPGLLSAFATHPSLDPLCASDPGKREETSSVISCLKLVSGAWL